MVVLFLYLFNLYPLNFCLICSCIPFFLWNIIFDFFLSFLFLPKVYLFVGLFKELNVGLTDLLFSTFAFYLFSTLGLFSYYLFVYILLGYFLKILSWICSSLLAFLLPNVHTLGDINKFLLKHFYCIHRFWYAVFSLPFSSRH